MEGAIEARKVRTDLEAKYWEDSSNWAYPCAELFFVEDPCYKELPSHFGTIITLACTFRLEYCSKISGGVGFRVQFSIDDLALSGNVSSLNNLVVDSLFPFQANTGKLYRRAVYVKNDSRSNRATISYPSVMVTMCFRALLINCGIVSGLRLVNIYVTNSSYYWLTSRVAAFCFNCCLLLSGIRLEISDTFFKEFAYCLV